MPHTSVLASEVLQWLSPSPSGVTVDGTVGYGGHAERILERLGPDGRLLGFDKDASALALAGERLRVYGKKAMLIHDDFKHIPAVLKAENLSADGILLDLGVSSMQLDEAERGFSFSKTGPLDMRMNPAVPGTAADIVNRFSEAELARLFFEFGEERFSRRIASRIAAERRVREFTRTTELADAVWKAVPASYRHGRIHPATRIFQALRIAVNDEMGALRGFLDAAPDVLKEGGRLVVISFHSLEDRMVKHAFRAFEAAGLGKVKTKKPVLPTDEEAAENPRARSAKMRVFEKGTRS